MLFFIRRNAEGWDDYEREWHVGEPKPSFLSSRPPTEVYADGDELEYILARFPSCPRVMGNVRGITWVGDWAAFIYFNLSSTSLVFGTGVD